MMMTLENSEDFVFMERKFAFMRMMDSSLQNVID